MTPRVHAQVWMRPERRVSRAELGRLIRRLGYAPYQIDFEEPRDP